jgi:hypothetical protein
MLVRDCSPCIIHRHGFCVVPLTTENYPCEETMSEPREDDFASRAATYFVFIFLIAAVIETLFASLGG